MGAQAQVQGGDDAQMTADTVVFDGDDAAGIVLEIARRQVGADHAQRGMWILVEQGVVHPIDDHHRAVNEGIDPFGVFIRAEHQIKADRDRIRVTDADAERQGGGVIGLGLEHRVDDGVDVGIAVVEAAAAAVVGPEPGKRVAGAGSGAGGEQHPGSQAQGRPHRSVIEVDRARAGGVQHDAERIEDDAGVARQQRVDQGARREAVGVVNGEGGHGLLVLRIELGSGCGLTQQAGKTCEDRNDA